MKITLQKTIIDGILQKNDRYLISVLALLFV